MAPGADRSDVGVGIVVGQEEGRDHEVAHAVPRGLGQHRVGVLSPDEHLLQPPAPLVILREMQGIAEKRPPSGQRGPVAREIGIAGQHVARIGLAAQELARFPQVRRQRRDGGREVTVHRGGVPPIRQRERHEQRAERGRADRGYGGARREPRGSAPSQVPAPDPRADREQEGVPVIDLVPLARLLHRAQHVVAHPQAEGGQRLRRP